MKLCWDELERMGLHINSRGSFVDKNNNIREERVCVHCKQTFLAKKHKPFEKYCSKKCGYNHRKFTVSKIKPGQRFNRLKTIKLSTRYKCNATVWECVCDCGNKCWKKPSSLLSGEAFSCGCSSRASFTDIKGKKFGMLTPTIFVGRNHNLKATGTAWLCRCDCGNELYVTVTRLKSGHTKSCGCGRNNFISEALSKPLEKHINKINVALYDTYAPQLESIEDTKYEYYKGLKVLIIKCTYCGKFFRPTLTAIRSRVFALNNNGCGEGRLYCSDSCKQACPVFNKVLWPKGFKKATSREVPAMLRQMVLEGDNWTCQLCERTGDEVELHCHHVKTVKGNEILAADIDNCITFCKDCHKLIHSQEGCTYTELASCKLEED